MVLINFAVFGFDFKETGWFRLFHDDCRIPYTSLLNRAGSWSLSIRLINNCAGEYSVERIPSVQVTTTRTLFHMSVRLVLLWFDIWHSLPNQWFLCCLDRYRLGHPSSKIFLSWRSHTAYCVAALKATYAASVEDFATVDCFLLDELTVPLPN